MRNWLFDQVLTNRTKAKEFRSFQVELDFMGRVLTQVEQTSPPVPAQTRVHVDDEELQVVQDERDVHYLYVERRRP